MPRTSAAHYLETVEHDPDVDLERWLFERDTVVELFLDHDDLAARLGPLIARSRARDPEPQWNEALAARIAEAPGDLDSRIVFGDWLEQHGDPRGELIHLQASAKPPPATKISRGARRCSLELLDLRSSLPANELQALRALGAYVKGPRQRRDTR